MQTCGVKLAIIFKGFFSLHYFCLYWFVYIVVVYIVIVVYIVVVYIVIVVYIVVVYIAAPTSSGYFACLNKSTLSWSSMNVSLLM